MYYKKTYLRYRMLIIKIDFKSEEFIIWSMLIGYF